MECGGGLVKNAAMDFLISLAAKSFRLLYVARFWFARRTVYFLSSKTLVVVFPTKAMVPYNRILDRSRPMDLGTVGQDVCVKRLKSEQVEVVGNKEMAIGELGRLNHVCTSEYPFF